jgi:hypothetical protein
MKNEQLQGLTITELQEREEFTILETSALFGSCFPEPEYPIEDLDPSWF